MKPEEIRCQNDLQLYNTLLKHRDVIKVNEMIARQEEKGPTGLRRHLLATSVSLSKGMAPSVHKMADECIETLEMDIPLELYVFPSPQFNAMCFKPEEGRLHVMFSSSLLEGFKDDELKFVIGHELGHHVYKHHDIPIGYLLKGQRPASPRLALELFAWSRYAEISADRAGAHCAQNLDAVARALFKLASGLTSDFVQFDLDDFLKQVSEMQIVDAEPGQGAPKQDWFSTHPFSPMRVKALELFDQSVMANGDTSKDDLEVAVQGVMSLMEPSYLEGKTKTAIHMRRLLFAASICVANASDGISAEEIKTFEEFFGKGEFDKNLNVEQLSATLDDRIKTAKEMASVPQRMQVLRDLCTMSRSSGRTTEPERDVMNDIADKLDVPRSFICQSLAQDVEPD
ncbi:M48 family metallopeptidase [Leucothrix pacifica]|uniref:Peptidase M48 domain-containing protein n=1 Tax=Leucothrix pacifica TaxID=1247513 RepID=A0A317C6J1_9GAMM|nr:M48 family metallopeptidase [Leucothrix pacifica]PWQ93023.1 hypothetical protein DKW60_18215 [Leucothrix pacifica]